MTVNYRFKNYKYYKQTLSWYDIFLILLGLYVTLETITLGLSIVIDKPARWTHVLLPITGAVFWSAATGRLAERKEIEKNQIWLSNLPIFNTCSGCTHFKGEVKKGELFVCQLHSSGQQNCSDYLVNWRQELKGRRQEAGS